MEHRPDGVAVTPGTSILVAEDHPATRRFLEKLLTKAGYKVITARNGREALDRFKETFSPIVLIDWVMPEMDGLELCAALRNGSGQSYVYILIPDSQGLERGCGQGVPERGG